MKFRNKKTGVVWDVTDEKALKYVQKNSNDFEPAVGADEGLAPESAGEPAAGAKSKFAQARLMF